MSGKKTAIRRGRPPAVGVVGVVMRRIPLLCAIALVALAACTRGAPAPVTYGGSGGSRDDRVAGVGSGQGGSGQEGLGQGGRSAESAAPAATRDRSSGSAGVAVPRPQEKPRGVVRATAARSELTRAGIHTVKRGETVYELSRRYEVPLRAIIDGNDLRPPYTLYVGQEVRIPVPQRHVVQAGDTVYGISRAYGVDMSALTRVNDIDPPYTIEPGQVLVVPGDGRQPTQTAGRAAASSESDRAGTSRSAASDRSESGTASGEGASGTGQGQTGAPANDSEPARTQTASVSPPRPQEIPQPPPRSGSRFLWPVTGRVLAGFGPQDGGLHNDGINVAAPRGTPVRAAENGVVAYVGNELRGFGNLLLIKHADNWVTAYAHTDEVLVDHGEKVERGQIVARVGSSGSVGQPQLHFEIREGSKARDPQSLLGSQ